MDVGAPGRPDATRVARRQRCLELRDRSENFFSHPSRRGSASIEADQGPADPKEPSHVEEHPLSALEAFPEQEPRILDLDGHARPDRRRGPGTDRESSRPDVQHWHARRGAHQGHQVRSHGRPVRRYRRHQQQHERGDEADDLVRRQRLALRRSTRSSASRSPRTGARAPPERASRRSSSASRSASPPPPSGPSQAPWGTALPRRPPTSR